MTVQITSDKEIQSIFQQQQAAQWAVGAKTAGARIGKLKRLAAAVRANADLLKSAVYKDFGKPAIEVETTELLPFYAEVNNYRKNLRRWSSNQRVPTPLMLFGSRSTIVHEPKGVVLIIAPWNFPINLVLLPLVSAIAAGNSVMIKPSEMTPNTSAALKKVISGVFPPEEVFVAEGGVETSQKLLELPFNHIFFTGSPRVGKIVMTAAAKHLASVTLELGGKSPVILDETANPERAAKRLAWAKTLNAGQICLAPDYIFVHQKHKTRFIEAFRTAIATMLPITEGNTDFTKVVNADHFKRLSETLTDAQERGSQVLAGGSVYESSRQIAPTLLEAPPLDSRVMEEEIFGPLFPVFFYSDLAEPLELIRSKPKPLALYIFSHSNHNINRIMAETRAGTTAINHTVLHFSNENLPFGGSNNSGIGKSHGKAGFEAFSNQRGTFRQWSPVSGSSILSPPYTDLKKRIVRWMVRWW